MALILSRGQHSFLVLLCQYRGRGTWSSNHFPFSSNELRIQLHKKLPTFDKLKRDGISAIKFEAAQTHFFSDVFVAVAVVGA